MKIKVLTLPKAEQRQKHIKENIKLPYEFFWAIDGLKFRFKHSILNTPAVCTFLSHTNLILQSLNDDSDLCLILEDDVIFSANLDLINEKIQTLPEDWDIAFFGWYPVKFPNKTIEINDDWFIVNEFWGMHAYLIRKEKIMKLYDTILNIDSHIDIQISRYISQKKLNGYFLKKPYFNQCGKFESQIKDL
jgi:GR25 family glycosyltransferase involved in LPS biosynthesis